MTTAPTALTGELKRPANLMSLLRVPLAVVALVLRAHPIAVLALMAAAAVSDMLDGFMARRTDGDHRVGEWLDPVCDKVFVLAVVAGVWIQRRPPLWLLLALIVREVLVVPPILAHLAAPGREARRLEFRARIAGKATTVVQFATLVALMLGRMDLARPAAVLAALLGCAAGIDYALRARALLAPRSVA